MWRYRFASRVGSPSSLAIDLALAKLDLAAIRARRGLPFDAEARESAKLLKQFFSSEVHAKKRPLAISDKIMPRKDAREALEKALTTIPKLESPFAKIGVELLEQFLALLSKLADTGRCEPKQAEQLHSLLHSIEAQITPPLSLSATPGLTA